MSNEPKCVYIKTDVGYVQITYAEFCRIRNTTENYKASHWFIPVQGVLLEVPKDAYKAFYREKERERYLRKFARRRSTRRPAGAKGAPPKAAKSIPNAHPVPAAAHL